MQRSNKKTWFIQVPNLHRLAGLILTMALSTFATFAEAKKASPLETLAQETYVWGYPAVLMKQTREAMLEKTENPEKSVNHFFHADSARETFFRNLLTLNSENIYSWAWLDLDKEPLVFTQPAMAQRFFSVQFVDAFTNVFHVISNAQFAGQPVTFAITSPNWKGELPAGIVRLRATTAEVFVLAQTAPKTTQDFNEALKLHQSRQLIPLSAWKQGVRKDLFKGQMPSESFVVQTNLATLGVQFLDELQKTVQKNSLPTGADAQRWQQISKSLKTPYTAVSKKALERGLFAGARQIEDRLAKGAGPKVNGWSYEISAEPFREDYLTRAAVAQSSLFSVPGKEIMQLKATSDSEDRQLYSNYRYVMRFNKGALPPTSTSWTLRVYESAAKIPSQALEVARVNDRQRIFKTNKDGSVEIYLQTEAPDQAEQNNWLPLTEGAGFYVVLTVYNPEPSLQTRTFVAPSIERVEEGVLPRPRIVRTMMAQSHASK